MARPDREQAIARIEAAAAGGQLEPTERDARVVAVRNAITGTSSKRASNADREAVAARLQDAVEAGLLDVTEFDERVHG